MSPHDYTQDERIIAEAILYARHVQDFIWGDRRISGRVFDVNEWQVLFQKRVDCISAVDPLNPSAVIELRKRLLQQAALSIRALTVLQAGATVRGRKKRDRIY